MSEASGVLRSRVLAIKGAFPRCGGEDTGPRRLGRNISMIRCGPGRATAVRAGEEAGRGPDPKRARAGRLEGVRRFSCVPDPVSGPFFATITRRQPTQPLLTLPEYPLQLAHASRPRGA